SQGDFASQSFPVTHSLLSPIALASHLQILYNLGEVQSCTLIQHNLNDTYRVDTTTGQYVLRVSQARGMVGRSWRTPEEILYELDLVHHMSERGAPVAVPQRLREGSYLSAVEAPEGSRSLVLFASAPGQPITPMRQTESLAERYGRAMAILHNA